MPAASIAIPQTVARVRAIVREANLEQCVSLAGELDAAELEVCYNTADVFVLATLHETYCMAVAEALAHGLPVVSTRTGAIPDLVRDGDDERRAGLLAPPGDLPAMTRPSARSSATRGCAAVSPTARGGCASGCRRGTTRWTRWSPRSNRAASNDVP